MSIRTEKNNLVKLVVAIVLAIVMAVALLPVAAKADSADVNAAAKGVLQVNLHYRDDNNNSTIIGYGSGFLANQNTIITCAHVVNMTDTDVLAFQLLYADVFPGLESKSIAEVKDRLSYSVTISRDVTIPATITKQSVEMDWAILTLSQSIVNKTPLEIRDSETVEQTETVYAIGFPDLAMEEQDIRWFTSDDVTITSGTVNKITRQANLYSGELTDYLQTSVNLNDGNSGGPMVDADGNVVGICEGSKYLTSDSSDKYFYAVTINQVTDVLDSLGIEYMRAGDAAPTSTDETTESEPESESESETEIVAPVDTSALQTLVDEVSKFKAGDYSADSYADLTGALESARKVLGKSDASEAEVNDALTKLQGAKEGLVPAAKGLSLTWIIIIIAAVVVIAVVVILLIVLLGKKKKNAAAKSAPAGQPTMATPPYAQNKPQGAPQAPQGFTPVTPAAPTASVSGAGETTVLSQGAGETTVLSRNINGGTLTNSKTGEKIQINTEEFTIGRERAKVNYCISGNTTVGRVHARIVNRNGSAYIVDMKTTNGTFVNGVKCSPMQEVPIKAGDKITLSDEEFIYGA